MKTDFYLVTVVHCKKGFAKRVADLISDETCIFEKMAGYGDSIHIFTDSNFELVGDDKILLSEIILGIKEAVNHRHFTTSRYTNEHA